MNVKDALDLVMLRLGNRTDAGLRAAALLEMRLLQTRLEGGPVKPWFLWNRYSSPDGGVTFFELPAGGGSLALPATFLELDEDDRAVYLFDKSTGLTTSLSNVVARLPRDSILNMELYLKAPGDPSIPQAYQVANGRIYFRPLSDKVYIVQVPGYFAEPVVDDDELSENKWMTWFPDLMIAGTIYEIATKHLRDAEISAVAKLDFDEAKNRLMVDTEAKKHVGQNYVMGGHDR